MLIYTSMRPEAAIATLAYAHLGAVHSVMFGGFTTREVAVRSTTPASTGATTVLY